MSDVKLYDQIFSGLNENERIYYYPENSWFSDFHNANSNLLFTKRVRKAYEVKHGYGMVFMGNKSLQDSIFSPKVISLDTGWIFNSDPTTLTVNQWASEVFGSFDGLYHATSDLRYNININGSNDLYTIYARNDPRPHARYESVKINNNNVEYSGFVFAFGRVHHNGWFETSSSIEARDGDCALLHRFVGNNMKKTLNFSNIEVSAWVHDRYTDTKALITLKGDNNFIVINVSKVLRVYFSSGGNDNLVSLIHVDGKNNTVVVNVTDDSNLIIDFEHVTANTAFVMTSSYHDDPSRTNTNKLVIIGGHQIVSNTGGYFPTGRLMPGYYWEYNDKFFLDDIRYDPNEVDLNLSKLPLQRYTQPNGAGVATMVNNVSGRYDRAMAKFNSLANERLTWRNKTSPDLWPNT